jgi:hypothetical protein
MAGGDSYGASLAMSSSSGANLSGATDFSGGGNYGGTSYGPGSFVTGGGAAAAAFNPLVILAIIAGAVTAFVLIFGKRRRK